MQKYLEPKKDNQKKEMKVEGNTEYNQMKITGRNTREKKQ